MCPTKLHWIRQYLSYLYERTGSYSYGGQPILFRVWNRPSRLTRSKALVRSMKATYSCFLCFRYFSCSCRREKSYRLWSDQIKKRIVPWGTLSLQVSEAYLEVLKQKPFQWCSAEVSFYSCYSHSCPLCSCTIGVRIIWINKAKIPHGGKK